MKPFRYERASGVASACASAAQPAAKFIAGGTNLVDLMKLRSRRRRISSTSTRCRSAASKKRRSTACASARW